MKKLDFKQTMLLSSLIFGMFFGAGNLIFPVHLGQLAGGHWLTATIAFLLSATVIPLLALIALSQTRSAGVYDLAKPLGSGWLCNFFLDSSTRVAWANDCNATYCDSSLLVEFW